MHICIIVCSGIPRYCLIDWWFDWRRCVYRYINKQIKRYHILYVYGDVSKCSIYNIALSNRNDQKFVAYTFVYVLRVFKYIMIFLEDIGHARRDKANETLLKGCLDWLWWIEDYVQPLIHLFFTPSSSPLPLSLSLFAFWLIYICLTSALVSHAITLLHWFFNENSMCI